MPKLVTASPEQDGGADCADGDGAAGSKSLLSPAACDEPLEHATLEPVDIGCAAHDPQAGVEVEEETAQDEGLDNGTDEAETEDRDKGEKEGDAATEESAEKGGEDDTAVDDWPPMGDSAAEAGRFGAGNETNDDANGQAQAPSEGSAADAEAEKNDSAGVPTAGYRSHGSNSSAHSLSNQDDEHAQQKSKLSVSVRMGCYLRTALQQSSSPTEASADASRSLLADKALVKAIVKACMAEDVAVTAASGANGNSIGVVDSLVEEYRSDHPLLTRQVIASGIARFRKAQRSNGSEWEAENDGGTEGFEGGKERHVDHDIKLSRCINIVEEEMLRYEERIDAIRKRREKMAAKASSSRKKRKSAGDADATAPSPTPKRRGRPNTTHPETDLIDTIFHRYVAMRRTTPRLPDGAFELMVEGAKRDHDMEDLDLPLETIRKRVAWRVIHLPVGPRAPSGTARAALDAAYDRYVRAMASNGRALPRGALTSIVEAAMLEHGVPSTDPRAIERRVRARFREGGPAPPRPPSEGDAAPGARGDGSGEESEAAGTSSEEIDVAPARPRDPAHTVDEPLVATINNWLSQGLSVTRSQGLEIANSLMMGLNSANKGGGEDGNEDLKLGADWWKYFLKRNKDKLVHFSDKKPVGLPGGTLMSAVEAVESEQGMPSTDLRTSLAIESHVRARLMEQNPDLCDTELGACPPVEGDPPTDALEDEWEEDGEADEASSEESVSEESSSEESAVPPTRSRVPAHAVDEPLVATINNWLSQGLSVTRAQGLEIAKSLMAGLIPAEVGEVKLGIDWWKYFLRRNKEKLVHFSDKRPVGPESKADSIPPSLCA